MSNQYFYCNVLSHTYSYDGQSGANERTGELKTATVKSNVRFIKVSAARNLSIQNKKR